MKTGPSRERTAVSCAHESYGKRDLAAGWTGEELAQPDEIGIGVFVDPLPAHDEFFAEIPDVGDRSAERGDSKLEECEVDFEG